MNSEATKNCPIHKAEHDYFCISCKKLLCLQCKTTHQRDHMQFIHLADLSAQIITRMRQQLDEFRGSVEKEHDEVEALINEFDGDKRYLYKAMKQIEAKVLQMLQLMASGLTRRLQKVDTELQELKGKIGGIKGKYELAEEIYAKASALNAKKQYWEIYQIQEELKDTVLDGTDLKGEAVKGWIVQIQQQKPRQNEAVNVLPHDFLCRKEELKRCVNVSDYEYFKDLSKDMSRELANINKTFTNKTADLKQREFLLTIKNNGNPLIQKHDKRYLWKWMSNNRSGKKIELELFYKAKRDGFSAEAFHSRCDKIKPTLTLISADNQIFGGYTSLQWKETPGTGPKEDPTAFTFSLTKKVKCQIHPGKRKEAIKPAPGAGVYFGAAEIAVADKANMNNDSRATGGVSYMLPQGYDPRTFYADNFNFQVNDVEVYRVIY